MKRAVSVLTAAILFGLAAQVWAQQAERRISVEDYWDKMAVGRIGRIEAGGLLGERLALWRNKRLWHMVESGYLLSGFESRPGTHPWQGEHVGKWLHAATLAYEQTRDEKLGRTLQETVKRLLAGRARG